MAALGKLYARCKSGGGKSRGLGLTSVNSSPALSSLAGPTSTQSLRRNFPRVANMSLRSDSLRLTPRTRAPVETDSLLGGAPKESYETETMRPSSRYLSTYN